MENEIVLAKEEYAALKEFARPVRSPRSLYGAHRPCLFVHAEPPDYSCLL